MGRKLLKTVQTITTFRNPLADPVGSRRGPPLVSGPQFENRCSTTILRYHCYLAIYSRLANFNSLAASELCRVC